VRADYLDVQLDQVDAIVTDTALHFIGGGAEPLWKKLSFDLRAGGARTASSLRIVSHLGGCFGRHLHKDRAIRQVYLASPCCKTENRVRAEPRYSEISERQFGARFHSCAHCSTQCDFIIHDRGTRRGTWFQQPHVLNYLGDACLL